LLEKAVLHMWMTREESERKQLAYEAERARWRKEIGSTKSDYGGGGSSAGVKKSGEGQLAAWTNQPYQISC
jgi:hypothetical protein